MIRVQDVRKRFGSQVAVDGLSLEVAKGEVLGLLGPNGAGKTTTIHMIMGALQPDSGTIEVEGASARDAASRKSLGLAPQALALYEDLTGEENLRLLGEIYDLRGPKLIERVDWALAFAGLFDRRKDFVRTYSGGMKRRLNVACALVHEPKVVFLDEPTVGVDPQSRNHIFESVEELRAQGLTVLYTTHYMEEAERLCTRVGIVDHGKLLALGDVPSLIGQHGGVRRVRVNSPDGNVPSGWRQVEGGIERETDDVGGSVSQLIASGHKIERLEVLEPNLEDVFLNLTGRNLRD